MKTFKQLREQQRTNLQETFDVFSEEEYAKFIEDGIFSEEEILEIKTCINEYSTKEFSRDLGDVSSGYAQGLLGKERFKRWGGKARSFFTGKSPEEEEKKIEKSQQIRKQRSPTLFKSGERVGRAIPSVVGATVGSRVGGKLGGSLGRVVGGVTGGAMAGGGAEYLKKSEEERERLKRRAEELKRLGKERAAEKSQQPSDAAKPAKLPTTQQKLLPGTKQPDDLEKAKELIKKREASVSPIYKVGDVLGKLSGGSKEVESGVADTYSRLSKDPKAAAEFLKIQQQRNKEMGVK
jgi:hypothetical protein